MNINPKLIAIIAVIVIVVAGVAVVMNNNSNAVESDIVTITQNDGVKVDVKTPVTSVCVVNTNAAEFLSMVGLSDKVVGVSSTMKSKPAESWWAERANIGTYKTVNGEALLETGSTVVIGQCTSMAIQNVDALKALGITVILLDCFGFDAQINDLRQLISIFDDSDAMALVDKYESFFNEIVDTISLASSTITDVQRKTFVSSMGIDATAKYYTGASELSYMLCNVCGMKNAINEIDSSITSPSAMIYEEAIVKYHTDNKVDLFVLRNNTAYSKGQSDVEEFLSTHDVINKSGMFDNIDVVKTADSKTLSGPRCFVGMIYFVSFVYPELDIDGLTVDSTISEYNSLFGTNWSTENLFYLYS